MIDCSHGTQDQASGDGGRLKYWAPVEAGGCHAAELELIPPNSKVLEIGPGPGHMTRQLVAKGCEVTAIEEDPRFASHIRSVCKHLIIADIERADLDIELGSSRFDVILLGDVLEHMKAPDAVLRALRPHVSHGGRLVVSIPNVAHASVRLSLLNGTFRYQAEGLLDATHLRFFTLDTIVEMFHASGYRMSDLTRVSKDPFETEIPVDPCEIPLAVLRRLVRDPEHATYQFVFKASPNDGPHTSHCPQDVKDLQDSNWEPKLARKALGNVYLRGAWAALQCDPPIRAKAWKLAYRAMCLSPSAKATAYILIALVPNPFTRYLRHVFYGARSSLK